MALSPALQFREVARTMVKLNRLGVKTGRSMRQIGRDEFNLTNREIAVQVQCAHYDLKKVGVPGPEEEALSPCHAFSSRYIKVAPKPPNRPMVVRYGDPQSGRFRYSFTDKRKAA